MGMIVRDEDFEVLCGQTVRYDRKADSCNVIAMDFCAHCHGWLWNVPVVPGIKMVRVGTLDNMDWAEPVGNQWTDSKAAWVKIDPELVNFPKQAVGGRRCSTPGPGTINVKADRADQIVLHCMSPLLAQSRHAGHSIDVRFWG